MPSPKWSAHAIAPNTLVAIKVIHMILSATRLARNFSDISLRGRPRKALSQPRCMKMWITIPARPTTPKQIWAATHTLRENPGKTISNLWRITSHNNKPVMVVIRRGTKIVTSSQKLRLVVFNPLPPSWCGIHGENTRPTN